MESPAHSDADDQELPSVVQCFRDLRSNEGTAIAVAAVRALTEVLKSSTATTMMEVQQELDISSGQLQAYSTAISLRSGCELFARFVTRTSKETFDKFDDVKRLLIERGEQFMHRTTSSRQKICSLADPFISDGHVVLVHGMSSVVLSVLEHAAASEQKRFSVFVTESRPDNVGYKMAERLSSSGIPTTLIMDSAAAHLMGKVDIVLVGAEAVVENGGIINKTGTFQIAIAAKAFSRPLYVAAECFKFARVYPLDQFDLPEATREGAPLKLPIPSTVQIKNPQCDYTPPAYITLLLTDLGVLTPSGVSDELIKLYN